MPRGEFYEEFGGLTPGETNAQIPSSTSPGSNQSSGETPQQRGPRDITNNYAVYDLARKLLPGGGWTAGYLEGLIGLPMDNPDKLSPDVANAAMVLKDSWLHQARSAWAGQGPGLGSNLAWQQLSAANPAGVAQNLAAWMPPADIYQQYTNQPVMGWQPGALPEMYRGPAESFLRGRGFRPTGSLGVYGYTGYTPPPGGANFSPEVLSAIPDEGLRKWLAWYMSRSGLMAGNYPQP